MSMRITAIVPSRKHPERASIKVDGRFVGALTHAAIEALGLAVGGEWDDALAQRVADAVAYDKALRAAMRRLDRRAMSCRQISDKLRTLGFTPAVIERVVARLIELNVLDDRAFGEALMREIQRGKPAGPRLLRVKLMQKGLDRQLIDELLGDVSGNPQVDDELRQLAERKLRSLMRFDVPTRKRRLWSMLARRGFDGETIEHTLSGLPGLSEDLEEQAF